MPSLDQCLELPPQPTSARRARLFVGEILGANGIDSDTAEICLLLTSELVTNAVLYARSNLMLRVMVDDGPVVRISVHDDSPVSPVPRPANSEDTSGRGLALVELLSTSWGVIPNGRGKGVWFEVGL